MEEMGLKIGNRVRGCITTVKKNGINHRFQLVQDFQPSTVNPQYMAILLGKMLRIDGFSGSWTRISQTASGDHSRHLQKCGGLRNFTNLTAKNCHLI